MLVGQITHSIIRSERRRAGRYGYCLYCPSGLDVEAWGGSGELICLQVSGPAMVAAGQTAGTKKPAVRLAWIGLLSVYSDGSIRLESQKNAAMNSMAPIALYISCLNLTAIARLQYFLALFTP